MPNGSLSHLILPQGVLKLVSRLLGKSSSMCHNLDVESCKVQYLSMQVLAACHPWSCCNVGSIQWPCSGLLDPGIGL